MLANTAVMLYLWQADGRFPQTLQEKWLVGGAVIVGIVMSLVLLRPLLGMMRFLVQRRKPRGLQGRWFMDKMAAGKSYLYPGGLALRGRDLRQENLADAFLADADLSDTDLRGVDLSNADLERACLSNADLRGADLTGANLVEANLRGVRYDADTRWPVGFDPRRLGCVEMDQGS